MDFAGDIETHLTIDLERPEQLSELDQWGVENGWKCVHIVLDRGAHASQPMLTRHRKGTLPDELAAASEVCQTLRRLGWSVSRLKIEAAPWNQDVPQTEAEALAQPGERYFEHHVKLLLPTGADLASLKEIAAPHQAHLSRNARRQRADGYEERFVTQRCWAVGQREARHRLDKLLAAIGPLNYPVLEVEEEYVVYDSNLALDAGWFSTEE
jgi:hypothetical protein